MHPVYEMDVSVRTEIEELPSLSKFHAFVAQLEELMGRMTKPVRIPIGCIVLRLSDFRDFSDFVYELRRIPNFHYLSTTGWRL